jgi:hypothetical protein
MEVSPKLMLFAGFSLKKNHIQKICQGMARGKQFWSVRSGGLGMSVTLALAAFLDNNYYSGCTPCPDEGFWGSGLEWPFHMKLYSGQRGRRVSLHAGRVGYKETTLGSGQTC